MAAKETTKRTHPLKRRRQVGNPRRRAWAAFRTTFTLASLALGPNLVWAQAAAPAKPDPAKAQQLVTEVCAACHGADGNSTSPANPKLAAQHPDYLAKQLHDFKPKEGKPAARASPIMAGLVAALSDADMANLAAYYAGQKLKPSVARDKDTVELGRQIFRGGIAEKHVPACAGCHSPNGAGMPSQYPRLAGQYADYTRDQLVLFRSGKRGNSPQMETIAARLSDKEIAAVADYMAGLR